MALGNVVVVLWLVGIAGMAYSKFGITDDKKLSDKVFKFSLLFFLVFFVAMFVV
jgi:heme O synthase-like polyprenyltransferase